MKSRFSNLAFVAIAFFCGAVSSHAQITLNATDGWTATGVSKTAANMLFVCATGSATVWPNPRPACPWASPSGRATGSGCASCVCASCPTIALIGRIGNSGAPFFLGDQAVLGTGIANGELQIRVNDNPANYGDNSGSFSVTVGTTCNGCGLPVSLTGGGDEKDVAFEEVTFAAARVVVNNPVFDEVTTNFLLETDSRVALNLYTLDGQLINSVQESTYPSGAHEIKQKIEGASGMYVLQIVINDEIQTRKIIVAK